MSSNASESAGPLRCRILTPEGMVCDQQTDFVAVWLEDGELGIAAGRKPMLARLGAGPLRIGRLRSQPMYYYVEGGLVEAAEGVVTVFTERAIPASELEAAVAAERLRAARALRSDTPELQKRRLEALRIAQAQWQVVQAAGRQGRAPLRRILEEPPIDK